jgi:hypothetical protein
LGEITQELVNIISAAQRKAKIPGIDDQYMKEAGEAALRLFTIQASISHLQPLARPGAPLWGYRKENTEAAKKLKRQAAELKTTIGTMPEAARLLLFMPEEDGVVEQMPQIGALQNSLVRARKVIGMLNYLDARCSQIVTRKPGKHPGTEHVKHQCAEEAWRLMRNCLLEPASGIETSSLGKIARLLYEAVTGKRDIDLAHECRVAVEHGKTGDIPLPACSTIGRGRVSINGLSGAWSEEDELVESPPQDDSL